MDTTVWSLIGWYSTSSKAYSLGSHTAFGCMGPQSIASFFQDNPLARCGQHTPVIPALGRLSQDCKFGATLGYVGRSCIYIPPSQDTPSMVLFVIEIKPKQLLTRPLTSFQLWWDVCISRWPQLWESSGSFPLSPNPVSPPACLLLSLSKT